MDSGRCGEASAASKFVSSAFQDISAHHEQFREASYQEANVVPGIQSNSHQHAAGREAAFFEFKDDASVSWAAEFAGKGQKGTAGPFPVAFEEAFMKASLQEPAIQASQEWAQQFHLPQERSEWVGTYKEPSADAAEWVKEFQAQEGESGFARDEERGLATTAATLLSNLDLSEPKLANSKFVAYLRELSSASTRDAHHAGFEQAWKAQPVTGKADFEQWKRQYRENIAPIVDDYAWDGMEKDWEKYEGTGLGYRDFAKHEFQHYHLSVPIEANPYTTSALDSRMALVTTFVSLHQSKEAIMALEAEVHAHQENSRAWLQLGLLQQENEIDIQAIAALQKAVSLDPTLERGWLALAASCVNENCIPDAYDALEAFLLNDPDYKIFTKTHGYRNEELVGLFSQAYEVRHDPNALIGLSVLYNMGGDYQKAVGALEQAIRQLPEDATLWNRLGATYANIQDYPAALTAYSRALALRPSYSRAHYNRGISLMSLKRSVEASESFVTALENQLPVAEIERSSLIRDELKGSFSCILETLRIHLENAEISEAAKMEAVRSCETRDLPSLRALFSGSA